MEWISCKDKLPPKEGDYPCAYKGDSLIYLYSWSPEENNGGGYFLEHDHGSSYQRDNVDYWFDLPNPPEEK